MHSSLNAQSEIQILKDSDLLMLCMMVRIETSLSTFNIPAKKFMNTGSLRNGTFVLSKFVLVKLCSEHLAYTDSFTSALRFRNHVFAKFVLSKELVFMMI